MYLAAGGRERAARGSQRSPGGGCGGQRLPPEPPTMAEGGSAAPEPTNPQREPEGRAREASATNLWFGADHWTSAITSGGLWPWVIVAWRPTTSDAGPRASASGDGRVKPKRRHERGPQPTNRQGEPEGRAREASAPNLWFGADHRTSAITSGGLWTWVIVAWRPTTSDASSRASSSVDAGVKPRRRTERGSPPTMITLPRCWRAWLPQYHM